MSNCLENGTSIRKNIFAIAMKEFFENVLRYQRYFITITLGIFFALFGWLKPLLKNPITAVALVGFLISSLIFVALTLQGMLGLSTL